MSENTRPMTHLPGRLAIFDLDNTLIAGDSDHAWGEFVSELGMVDPDSHRAQNDKFYEDYCKGQLDIYAYQQFALSTIAGKTPNELAPILKDFIRSEIEPIQLEKAKQLLEKHASDGDTLLIVTATNDFVTAPIAKLLGVSHLLACQAEITNGVYTGNITGTPTFHDGKVRRLQEWLQNQPYSLEGSYFYSDSHNDIPLLELVCNPVAVDPDDTLKAYAQRKNWPVISLR